MQLSGLTALLVPEAIVTVVGLLSLWVIWALRDQSGAADLSIAEQQSEH